MKSPAELITVIIKLIQKIIYFFFDYWIVIGVIVILILAAWLLAKYFLNDGIG